MGHPRLANTSDTDLIMLYKHAMVSRFMGLRVLQDYWHPTYKHNSIQVPTNRFMSINKLYGTHEMTLLTEMWERCINGTFYEQAWWQSKKLFQTTISLWSKPDEKSEEPTVETIQPVKESKPIEFIMYNDEKYEYLASGSKRKTYVSKDKSHVIKVPKEPTRLGIEENLEEAKVYSETPNSIYAKCELI